MQGLWVLILLAWELKITRMVQNLGSLAAGAHDAAKNLIQINKYLKKIL